MNNEFINERIKNLEEITARHSNREIEGCKSWRHFVVHQDREWLLNAVEKIKTQVGKINLATDKPGSDATVEVQELLAMFEPATLNCLGGEEE